jgi:hypothetical protein
MTVKNYELPNFGNFIGAQARLVGLACLPDVNTDKPWTLNSVSFFANKKSELPADAASSEPTTLLLAAGYFDNQGEWAVDNQIVVSYNIEIAPSAFVYGTATAPGGSVKMDFGDASGPFFLALFADANDADDWLAERELTLSTYIQRDI